MLSEFICWITKTVVRMHCTIFIKLDVQGLENIPQDSGGILAANHRSTFDGFLLYSLINKKVYTLIKSDFFQNPLLCWYLKIAGGIPVKKGASRLSSLRDTQRILRGNNILMVFPEGRVNPGVSLLPFQNTFMGLSLKHHVPIIPVIIIGSERVLARGQWIPRPGEIQVIIKEPIMFNPPSDDKDTIDLHAQQVRQIIAQTLVDPPIP
ncbi:MAG: lysophospholipid acyltransferase family protein [Candidatus Binatia bacterium]